MNDQHTQAKKPLKDSLFERIESEKVCPRSRVFFLSQEYSFWFLWLLSVVIGALAFSVSLFVVLHGQYALYEATHDNFFTFFADSLPFIWIFVLTLMVFVAVYNIRHTKRGYRYPLWLILASSVVLSFAGGSAMQLFGLGHEIDEVLGEHMALYMSQGKFEERLWQDPDDGRLVGHLVFTTLAPSSTVIFEDMAGKRWTMNVTELNARDMELLASGETVRLLGKELNNTLHFFHACGAFPWMADRPVTSNDMYAERQVFIERVYEHARKLEEARRDIGLLKTAELGTMPLPPQSVCASIEPVKRMPRRPVAIE